MKLSYATLMFAPLLWGCERAPVEPVVPMKSATYYAKHLPEAAQVVGRCKQLNERQRRRLGERDYQEWRISNEWASCQTARSVLEAAALRDSLLKQSPSQQAPTPLAAGADAALAP